MANNIELKAYLDNDLKLIRWPSKNTKKLLALQYLAEKFEFDKDYTEKEINEIIKQWHTFEDHVMLRRALCDQGFLERTKDASKYWMVKDREAAQGYKVEG